MLLRHYVTSLRLKHIGWKMMWNNREISPTEKLQSTGTPHYTPVLTS